jgi:N-acetylmuramoyl-L-alanine amidase
MSWKTGDGIRVFTRADWDARRPRTDYDSLGQVRSAVIHHGGPVGAPRWTFTTAAQTLRSWQDYHMDFHGWNDLGYHFAMDALGRLYEGRPPTALGAHVAAQNSHRVGIVLMQDGRFHGTRFAQRGTLRKLVKSEHDRLGLPALGRLVKHPGAEWGVFGHREVPGQSTECPGREILADVHKILKEVR